MRSAYIIAFAVIAALSSSAHAQTGQGACGRLRSLQSGSSRILTAEYSAASEFSSACRGVIQSGAYLAAGALLGEGFHLYQLR